MKTAIQVWPRLVASAALSIVLVATIAGAARAQETDMAPPAQGQPLLKVGDQPEQDAKSDWREREAKLLELVAAATAEQAKQSQADPQPDWAAIEKNLGDSLYRRASEGGNRRPEWPTTQLNLVEALKKWMERDGEKEREVHTDFSNEMKILEAVATSLRAEADKKDEPAVAAADEDDTLWRFRDKSGARTTKPRYKGQEPIN